MKIDLTKKDSTIAKAYAEQDYIDILKKYRDPATVYAYLVLEGKQLAGYKIKLACLRHLQDLQRSENHDPNFPYHYDLKQCHSILNFAKLCPDVSAGKPLPLMMWQQTILCLMQGWRDDLNHKRFTRVLLSVARTNGKTYIVNIMMWYAYVVEAYGQYNQDFAYIAPIAAQAKKGWNYVSLTGTRLAELPSFEKSFFKKLDVAVQDEQVRSKVSKNKILRLSNESGKFDSYHFLFVVFDEAGDKNNDGTNLGKITSGQIQTPNHQFVQISTAYENSSVPFYRDEQMMTEAMEKDYSHESDEYLCLVWEQDSLNEQDDPATWEKSNPILGLANSESTIKGLIDERNSKLNDGTIKEFQNRNLNMWLQVKEDSYLELEDIESSVIAPSKFDMTGHDVYIGWDLSHFSDDTALSFVFPYKIDDNEKYFVYQHSFIPLSHTQGNINIKEAQDGIKYSTMEKQGWCDITKNAYGEIDEGQVFDWLLDFVNDNKLNVKFFCYDPYRAGTFTERLESNDNLNWYTSPIRQGTLSLDSPTTWFRKQMHMHNITMYNDGILQYSLKNAILKRDNNGIKVDKDLATAKIDCVDATIDAVYEAMYYFTNSDHDVKETKSPFGNMTNDDINNYFKNNFSF